MLKQIYLILFTISPIAYANNLTTDLPFLNAACKSSYEKFCSEEKSTKDILSCFKKNDSDLSIECKQDIERWVQMTRQSMRRGGGALSSFGGMGSMGPAIRSISLESRLHRDSKNTNQYKLNLTTPVAKFNTGSLAATFVFSTMSVNENTYLDSGVKLPTTLQRIEVGTQYFQQLENKDNWGLKGSVGFSGDDVLKTYSDTSFSLNAHYAFNPSLSGFWIATIFIGNNTFLGNYIPIPGFIYFYKTATFTGLFGFPILSMQWTPTDQIFSYGLSLFGPTLTTEVNYGSIDEMQFFTNFSFSQQNYILKNRTNDKDRLTLEEKKLGFGLRTPIMGFIGAEFQIAKAYDRQFYIGQGLFNKDGGKLDLNNETELSINLRAAF